MNRASRGANSHKANLHSSKLHSGNTGSAKESPRARDSHGQRNLNSESRWQPWLLGAATALLVARPLIPSEVALWRGDGLPLSMAWFVLLCAWAIDAWRRQATICVCLVDAGVLALLAWHSLSALVAVRYGAPRPAISAMWEWLAFGVIYFLLRQLISTKRQVFALVLVMAALAACESILALEQYFVTLPATRATYAANPDEVLRNSNQWYPPGSRERALFEQRLRSLEPLGTFALTNSLAGFLVPWIICVFGVTLGMSTVRGRSTVLAATVLSASGLFLLLSVTCLLLTKSRSGIVALAAGLVLLALLVVRQGGVRIPRWAWLSAIPVIALVIGLVLLAGGLDREVLSQIPLSLGYRLQYWTAAVQMIADHPLVGCGPGNFGDVYTQYKLPTASEEISDPHNWPLEIAATAGISALLAALSIPILLWWRWRPAESTVADTRDDNALPILIGGACGYPLAAIVGPMMEYQLPLTSVVMGLVLTLVAYAVCRVTTPEPSSLSAAVPSVAIPSAGILSAAILAAIVALLVNLLAAGGIGFPGVAWTLWCLIALLTTLNVVDRDTFVGTKRDAGRSHRTHVILLAISVLLLLACFFTAYQPTLTSRALLSQAAADPAQRMRWLTEAAAADTFSAEAQQQLAQVAWQQWQASGDRAAWQVFTEAMDRALVLRPRSSAMAADAGRRYLAAYDITRNPADLDTAIRFFTRAVELYPNQAGRRAQLAIALFRAEHAAQSRAGRAEEARQQAEQALDLSRNTPHLDQKLSEQETAEIEAILAATER